MSKTNQQPWIDLLGQLTSPEGRSKTNLRDSEGKVHLP